MTNAEKLQEVLDSRETKYFTGFTKEVLVNLLRWQPGTNEGSGDYLETGTYGRVFTVLHASKARTSSGKVWMDWEMLPSGRGVLTTRIAMSWPDYVRLRLSGALVPQYSIDNSTGNRLYVTPETLVLVDASQVAELSGSYIIDPTAVVPKWSDPVMCGQIFKDKGGAWPVEPMKTVVSNEGRVLEMNVYEQLFYLHTGRRVPTASQPEQIVPANIMIWGGGDTDALIENMATKEKFVAGSGSDVELTGSAQYNTLFGTDPINGSFRITIPYVGYDNTYGGFRINMQDPDDFVWKVYKNGDESNWWHEDTTGQTLTGDLFDGAGNKYSVVLQRV